ncbi:hypothetical protein C8R43DRAFT_887621 [Mycena crocata]|nr:hypothetical protein C8R43DRAFT_887621 [Mycena crocata]
MRYASCTDEDIAFLRSRVASDRPGHPHLDTLKYRNVSVITALNIHKDTINELGAERFAEDTGQELVDFYSVDKLSARAVQRYKWVGCQQARFKTLGPKLQKLLWDAAPSTTTEHVPGRLRLCVGMPVMIKVNEATELCMTKGQEAVVMGWDASVGPSGQKILDTLFVKLVKPPRDIQIPDLPLNVVPLGRTPTPLTVLLQDDSLLSLTREQVLVLPNFAMTDYASQGKSRDINVCHLNNCKDHRAYYVALSRGFSAADTVILQGFDPGKITGGVKKGGMTGYLRQEFRELELLDEITKLRYEDKLPRTVTGIYRGKLLASFKKWKGAVHSEPLHFHETIKWNAAFDNVDEHIVYGEWKPTLTKGQKRKLGALQHTQPPPTKRQKVEQPKTAPKPLNGPDRINTIITGPMGLIWDSTNHSCAYDALFTSLGHVWKDRPAEWTVALNTTSPLLGLWALAMTEKPDLPEHARDAVRRVLHLQDRLSFPLGPIAIRLDPLFMAMTDRRSYGAAVTYCEHCRYRQPGFTDTFGQYMDIQSSRTLTACYPHGIHISQWFHYHFDRLVAHCPQCRFNGVDTKMRRTTTIGEVPKVMVIGVGYDTLLIEEALKFDVGGQGGGSVTLKLRGLIYHSAQARHFTSVVADNAGYLWYHDGIATKRGSVRLGQINDIHDRRVLHSVNGGKLCAAIYAAL